METVIAILVSVITVLVVGLVAVVFVLAAAVRALSSSVVLFKERDQLEVMTLRRTAAVAHEAPTHTEQYFTEPVAATPSVPRPESIWSRAPRDAA